MIQELKSYLIAQGYENISVDFMPDEKLTPEAVYLGQWDHSLGEFHDGTSSRYVQIQVRRYNAEGARADCNRILALLDSGTEEEVIHLSPKVWCIGRPTRGATIISRTNNTTTYYGEVTLWGET